MKTLAASSPDNLTSKLTSSRHVRAASEAAIQARARRLVRMAEPLRFALGRSSLGYVLVAGTRRGLRVIALGDDPDELIRDLRRHFPQAEAAGEEDGGYAERVATVVRRIDDPTAAFDVPLELQGSDFQRQVWRVLTEIPVGTTLSYSAVAARIGRPDAVRAVASACAANTLAVVIPCHRVLRNDGSITGYRWGVERKRALLAMERRR